MEIVRFPSRGGFSVRSILAFAFTVIIAALLWTTLASSPTQAVPGNGIAGWQNGGNSLVLNQHVYNKNATLADSSGTIPSGATVYQSPVQNGPTSSSDKKVFVIYFAPGVDPPSATTATYVEFTYNNGTLSNPQEKQDITVEAPGANGESGSSCSVSGIGWIVCPVSEFMANAMDVLFGIMVNMIEVQPSVLGDPNNSMYTAWNVMRNIANIAFVIGFLIIIYSQLTSIGISNYGLKKLIPRLIVAAVLVNISFYIAAFAIDVSNILGYSIQEVFNIIREDTFHLTNDNVSGFNTNVWGAVTAAALAGGGLVGGVYYLAVGGPYLILSLLVGLLLTAIFVIIILAARQAIIVILVIIAPLAFVANLLPNTEKWFEKWKDLFFTMLIFFPAFSLVFGGAQLAGQIIIQNAGDDFVTLVFGLAVQIAPLVITPLILKLSGTLLGRIAQIGYNPRKGAIDRTRNWAEKRAEHMKYQNMERGMVWKDKNGRRRFSPSALGSGMVRKMDNRRRNLENNTDIWKQKATNRYEQTEKYAGRGGIYERRAEAELEKNAIHSEHEGHVERLKATSGTRIHDTAMRAQLGKEKLETRQQDTAGYYNMLRTVGGTSLNESTTAYEVAKANASTSEQNKEAYLNQMRTFRSTQLGAAAERLETAKLNAEGMQSRYSAHVDSLKVQNAKGVVPNSSLANAAVFAQSNKEHAEAAQNRVQTMFDRERVIEGSQLNTSTVNLEGAKLQSEEAKNVTTRYISDAKSNFDGLLHVQNVRTEKAKSAAQIGETQLKRVVEEYKTGKLTPSNPELTTLMEGMVSDTELLAAEARGVQAAQNIQQRSVAEAFTEMVDLVDANGNPVKDSSGNIRRVQSDRANQLLNIAASVDPHGRLRAKSAATSQLSAIESEALKNNIILLDDQAEERGANDIAYARSILQRQLGTYQDPETKQILPKEDQDPGLLEAAVEKLAQDGDIGSIRTAMMSKLGGDGDEHQGIMNRVIARNAGTLKGKGGFDIQQKVSGLWGASREEMDQSIAFSLGAITAENISGQKWGWWDSYAKEDKSDPLHRTGLQRIIDNVYAMPEGTEKEREDKATNLKMLRSFYANLSTALTSEEIMTKIGDRNESTAEMHRMLDQRPGLIDKHVPIDYDLAYKGIASPAPRSPQPPQQP